MADFFITQGDTRPPLRKQLLDEDGASVDLSGAQDVVLHLEDAAGNDAELEGTVTVTDAEAGWVEYGWVDGDTSEAGTFSGEFEVTFGDGGRQTFPNPRKLTIEITRELG